MLLCGASHWSFAVALGTRGVISSKIKGCERGSRAGQRADDRLTRGERGRVPGGGAPV